MSSKTETIRRLVAEGVPGAPSAYTNPVLFAEFIVAAGLVDASSSTAEVLVRRVTAELSPKKVILASDFHVPFHNKALLANWLDYVEYAKPDAVVLGGDVFDCEAISRFPSAPDGPSLQVEIDVGCAEILDPVGYRAPGAEKVLLEGNHEERTRRLVADNPGLYKLRALAMPSLLGLEERGYEWVAYGDSWDCGELSVIHGHKVSKHSAYTAKAHLLDGGYDCVAHGHTHRLGAYWLTGVKGTRRAVELGCMADIDQATYVTGSKNWQNGFGVAYVWPDGTTHIQLIEATKDGAFVAEGKVFK